MPSVGGSQREPGGQEQKEEWEGPPRGHPSPLILPLITVMTGRLRLNNNRGFPVCAYYRSLCELRDVHNATHFTINTQWPLLVIQTLLSLLQSKTNLSQNDLFYTEISSLWKKKKNEKKLWNSLTRGVWYALILRLYDNPQYSSKVDPNVNTVIPGKPKSKEKQSKPEDLILCIPDTKAVRNEHPRLCSCFHQELLLPGNGDAGLGRSGWKPAS